MRICRAVFRTILFSVLLVSSFSNAEAKAFQLHTVKHAVERQAVCNDGSPAVYYFRKGSGSGSKNWVIFLGGGGFCYSVQSCNERWRTRPDLMTSTDKPPTVVLNGILSDSQTENPDFYNANQIVVPYCTSDLWSGDREKSGSTGGHEFRGFRVLRAIVNDLISTTTGPNLTSADRVLLSGTSAGGIGVMVHLDWLAFKLPKATVRGLNDAGWFPDLFFIPGVDLLVKQAVNLWNGKQDASCSKANGTNSYKCYLDSAYPHLQSPLLVQMSQYDVIALEAVGVDYPFDAVELGIAELFAAAIRSSLGPVDAAFSPRTLTHGLLPYRSFSRRKIDGNSLRDVTGNWFFDRPGPYKLIKSP